MTSTYSSAPPKLLLGNYFIYTATGFGGHTASFAPAAGKAYLITHMYLSMQSGASSADLEVGGIALLSGSGTFTIYLNACEVVTDHTYPVTGGQTGGGNGSWTIYICGFEILPQ